MWSTPLTFHTRGGILARSDKRQLFDETSLLYNAIFHSDKSRVRDETSLHYLRLLLPRGMALIQGTDRGKCLSEANRVLNPLSRTPTRGGVPTCGMWRMARSSQSFDCSAVQMHASWYFETSRATLPKKERNILEEWNLLNSSVTYKSITSFWKILQHRPGPPYLTAAIYKHTTGCKKSVLKIRGSIKKKETFLYGWKLLKLT